MMLQLAGHQVNCDVEMLNFEALETGPDKLITGRLKHDEALAVMEETLRNNVRGNSHVALMQAMDTLGLEFDVPLCRMIPMTDVRLPMKTDIQKLKAEFSRGYQRASACFYLAVKRFSMKEAFVTQVDGENWSPLWQKEDREFEEQLKNDPRLGKFFDRFFYVWDGNHGHIAWMDMINALHSTDASFHVPGRSVVLNVTPENCNMLLHAMTDWNK